MRKTPPKASTAVPTPNTVVSTAGSSKPTTPIYEEFTRRTQQSTTSTPNSAVPAVVPAAQTRNASPYRSEAAVAAARVLAAQQQTQRAAPARRARQNDAAGTHFQRAKREREQREAAAAAAAAEIEEREAAKPSIDLGKFPIPPSFASSPKIEPLSIFPSIKSSSSQTAVKEHEGNDKKMERRQSKSVLDILTNTRPRAGSGSGSGSLGTGVQRRKSTSFKQAVSDFFTDKDQLAAIKAEREAAAATANANTKVSANTNTNNNPYRSGEEWTQSRPNSSRSEKKPLLSRAGSGLSAIGHFFAATEPGRPSSMSSSTATAAAKLRTPKMSIDVQSRPGTGSSHKFKDFFASSSSKTDKVSGAPRSPGLRSPASPLYMAKDYWKEYSEHKKDKKFEKLRAEQVASALKEREQKANLVASSSTAAVDATSADSLAKGLKEKLNRLQLAEQESNERDRAREAKRAKREADRLLAQQRLEGLVGESSGPGDRVTKMDDFINPRPSPPPMPMLSPGQISSTGKSSPGPLSPFFQRQDKGKGKQIGKFTEIFDHAAGKLAQGFEKKPSKRDSDLSFADVGVPGMMDSCEACGRELTGAECLSHGKCKNCR